MQEPVLDFHGFFFLFLTCALVLFSFGDFAALRGSERSRVRWCLLFRYIYDRT